MTRQEAIEKSGLEVLGGHATPAEHRLVKAIARMLVVAINLQPRKKAPPDLTKLPFAPQELFDALEQRCADVVQLRPYEAKSFGRLGRNMAGVVGLCKEDLERVVAWIEQGGLKNWPVQVTWNHVVKHFGNWVGYARAWGATGTDLEGFNAGTWR